MRKKDILTNSFRDKKLDSTVTKIRNFQILNEATTSLWFDLDRLPLHKINEERVRAHLYHLLLNRKIWAMDIVFDKKFTDMMMSSGISGRTYRKVDMVLYNYESNKPEVFIEIKCKDAKSVEDQFWAKRHLRKHRTTPMAEEDMRWQLSDLNKIASTHNGVGVLVLLLYDGKRIPSWIRESCYRHGLKLLSHCYQSHT